MFCDDENSTCDFRKNTRWIMIMRSFVKTFTFKFNTECFKFKLDCLLWMLAMQLMPNWQLCSSFIPFYAARIVLWYGCAVHVYMLLRLSFHSSSPHRISWCTCTYAHAKLYRRLLLFRIEHFHQVHSPSILIQLTIILSIWFAHIPICICIINT